MDFYEYIGRHFESTSSYRTSVLLAGNKAQKWPFPQAKRELRLSRTTPRTSEVLTSVPVSRDEFYSLNAVTLWSTVGPLQHDAAVITFNSSLVIIDPDGGTQRGECTAPRDSIVAETSRDRQL